MGTPAPSLKGRRRCVQSQFIKLTSDDDGHFCHQVEETVMEEKPSRYAVRPPRDLNSQFDRRQADKACAEEERKRREAEAANAAVCVYHHY